MNRTLRSLFFGVLLVALPAFAGETLTVEGVLVKSAELHEKVVTVTGKVLDFKQKTSKKGNAYFTFKLKGAKDEPLSVYSRGKSEKVFKDGDVVLVTGTYRKEKKVQTFTVKNEVDATPEEGKPFGIKSASK